MDQQTIHMDLMALMQEAQKNDASDIHLLAGAKPVLRVYGKLRPLSGYNECTAKQLEEYVALALSDRQKEQIAKKGHTDFSIGRYRFNVYRQRGSYAFAIRIINKEIPTPGALGIPKSVQELINRQQGLILVTGPTGSGKSTTLASLIEEINKRYAYHIITLEDPVEYTYVQNKSYITQREIGTDASSYAEALTAALREDPDVILIGEMRDPDTFATALTAAETGHLVFATVHTNSAAGTIDRIIDSFPPERQGQIRSQLADTVIGIVSERLIPSCQGGRVAAYEVMLGTTAIRAHIREGQTYQIPNTIETSGAQGMMTLRDSLNRLAFEGYISKETLEAWNPKTI